MEEKDKLLKQLADDYSAVLKEAKSMGCNEIKMLYNIPLKNMEMIVQALEKQIPKKPTIIDYKKYIGTLKNAEFLRDAYWCPNCRQAIKCGTFCNKCGQRLDWIVESEE